MNAKLNKRERRAQLLAHYATCERLALHLGAKKPDGKKISVALFKLERDAHNAATAQCNGEDYQGQPYRTEEEWNRFRWDIADRMKSILGALPRGFFINGDPRGHALKIDAENPKGKALIEAVKLHTDWGNDGILSPEITGD